MRREPQKKSLFRCGRWTQKNIKVTDQSEDYCLLWLFWSHIFFRFFALLMVFMTILLLSFTLTPSQIDVVMPDIGHIIAK